MKQKATVEGKSMLFNSLFVLINLSGLAMITIGSHASFEENYLLFNFIGYIAIAISSAALFIFSGRLMMANVSRLLVGGLFIVSGLVKANDPIGFSYKLEEYFEDGALAYRIKEFFGAPGFSLEFLIQYALVLSVLICIVEIVLGVLVILGGKVKLVSYLLVIMMVFFTFLTWHTASCDNTKKFVDRDTYSMSDPIAQMKIDQAKTDKAIKIISKSASVLVLEEMKQPQCVDDCGCFGDAMKGSVGRSLTPSESLWKDFVLLYLVIWIFIAQWIIEPNTRKQNTQFLIASLLVVTFFSWVFGWYFPIIFAAISLIGSLWVLKSGGFIFGNYIGSSFFVTLISSIMIAYVLLYEPMKDYRPYAEGTNLIEKMKDGVVGEYESVLVYKNTKTGEKKEYLSTSKEYLASKIWEKSDWKYLEMTQKEVVATRIPSITEQFNPFLALTDITLAESNLAVVQELLKATKIKGLKILDLKYNSKMEVSLEEYSEDNFNPLEYKILDTIEMNNPAITDISIRDYIVKTDRILVLSAKNLMKGNWSKIERYKSIYTACKKNEIPFVLITNASREEINSFRKKNNFNVPVFLNDETELKAIARSNPSLLVVKKGKVAGKYPHRSTPSFEWLNKNVLQTK